MQNKFYEQLGCINTEPDRSYYIPFEVGQAASENRLDSHRLRLLNGKWGITDYQSIHHVPEHFLSGGAKAEIDVPSCVQMLGYDKPQYTNIRYPFPYNPPYVPHTNPAYHYTRAFELNKEEDREFYLIFEGVDSCMYLYVNNDFVGFEQGSHRMSEFRVTDYVRTGSNKIDVLVLKWCAGSYLEDQDKWRFTGIYRDEYTPYGQNPKSP